MKSLCVLVGCILLSAAGIKSESPLAAPHDSPEPIKVLRQTELMRSGHKTTFQLIEPPTLSPRPVPVPEPELSEPIEPQGPVKPTRLMMLSATIYDGSITELRWGSEGRQHHAFSNVDFLDLAGTGFFETEEAYYSLIFGVGISTKEQRGSQEVPLPAPSQFLPNVADYLLLPSPKEIQPDDSDLLAMDALHAFHNANKELLKERRLLREAENLRLQ